MKGTHLKKITTIVMMATMTALCSCTANVNTNKTDNNELKFDFGASAKTDVAKGYTPVTPGTAYNDSLGYGFATTGITAGGNAAADILNGDYVESSGNMIFKVKVTKGRNYTVKVTYRGTLATEKIDDSATGIARTANAELKTQTFDVPNVDGILDLNLASNAQISSLEIVEQQTKTALSKPALYLIGDSTTKNNGTATIKGEAKTMSSWGNFAKSTVFSSVNNNAMAGRSSAKYYNEGRLDNVLLAINPGDYVTINMGINGVSGSPFEAQMRYYIEGVMQRGGIAVILTSTPHGAVTKYEKYYDTATQTYNGARDAEGYIKTLRNLADEYKLDVVDVGALVSAKYTSMTEDARSNAAANGASATDVWAAGEAKAQWVINQYGDHNHYTQELAQIIAPVIMADIERIYNKNNSN